jgi:Response receiver domain
VRDLDSYQDAILYTFRERPIRSAILIDDKFPKYKDLTFDPVSAKEKYNQYADADRLYNYFHEKQILCDIENEEFVATVKLSEKIRKSDLVVLDWNLKDSVEDSEDALHILSALSRSEHFNQVVIYTADTRLTRVWLHASIRLCGGWSLLDDILNNHEKVRTAFYESSITEMESNELQELLSDELILLYFSKKRKPPIETIKSIPNIKEIIESAKLTLPEIDIFCRAFFQYGIHKIYAPPEDLPLAHFEGDSSDEKRFLLCGSVFVAFANKRVTEEGQAAPDILEHLDTALKAWNPSLLRLMVSELQNELEYNSYAFSRDIFPTQALQAGWIYHLLQLAAGKTGVDKHDEGIRTLNLRLADALRHHVISKFADANSELLQFSRAATELAFTTQTPPAKNPTATKQEQDARTAIQLSNSKIRLETKDIVFALNEYLSSLPFSGEQPTTGTVFCNEAKSEWYVCVTPSCDMIGHEVGDTHAWSHSLHPLKAMYLLRLETSASTTALAAATHGKHIFISIAQDGNKPPLQLAFNTVSPQTDLPRPRLTLLGGAIPKTAGAPNWQRFGFNVFITTKAESGKPELLPMKMFAVTQLRPENADRLLQVTGSYLSRVGVDFMSFKS